MFTQSYRWTSLLLLVTLSVTLCMIGSIHAGKGGKKPPRDDPPPTPSISYSVTMLGHARRPHE